MLKKVARRQLSSHGLSGSSTSLSDGRQPGRGQETPHFSLLGPVVLLAPLTLLGEWLITHTHHRPLGAATFASCAIILWLGFEIGIRLLFARRHERPEQVKRIKNGMLGMALLCCVMVFARGLL